MDSRPIFHPEKELPTERRVSLENDRFSIIATNRGAILREIRIDGIKITRDFESSDLSNGETRPGEKGALFCCPQIFARMPGRIFRFKGKEYPLNYPDGMDADKIDPDRVFIHGFEHYYTWDIASQSATKVRFELPREKFPKDYPFPHSSFVEYRFEGSDFVIEHGVFNGHGPAMLTVHPFFKWLLEGADEGPSLQTNLSARFEIDPAIPTTIGKPIPLQGGGPFAKLTKLPTDLDHSFISDGKAELVWPTKPKPIRLLMIDETSMDVLPVRPVQIWTSRSDKGMFGIEQSVPSNTPNLIADGDIPENWLPEFEEGQTISRIVRYRVT